MVLKTRSKILIEYKNPFKEPSKVAFKPPNLNNTSPGVRNKCKKNVSKNNIKKGEKPFKTLAGGSLEKKKGNIIIKESNIYAMGLLINRTDIKQVKTKNNLALGSRK